ncbi:response regulator [Spirulina subsalsa FACHB-351]|uniref:Response regulator n=2 Tax=Spirulina subsalsa TaxID=54311 RepID=A0ABT3L9J6_9CYAN|nr:response regulator [Spirulina subsalsa FACHB-351]
MKPPPEQSSDLIVPKVLAVDDSIAIQDLIRQILKAKYQVFTASNTVEALGILYHEKVNLMLLDISLPGVDGLELCRIIRKNALYKNLPIIMVTSRNSLSDKLEGKMAGASEYLTKPFDPKHLVQTIETLIPKVAKV